MPRPTTPAHVGPYRIDRNGEFGWFVVDERDRSIVSVTSRAAGIAWAEMRVSREGHAARLPESQSAGRIP